MHALCGLCTQALSFCILQSLRICHMAWHRCSICTSHPTAQQLENYLGRLLRGMCCLENWTALSAQTKTETSKDFFCKVAKLFATNICFLKRISRSKNPIAIRCPLSETFKDHQKATTRSKISLALENTGPTAIWCLSQKCINIRKEGTSYFLMLLLQIASWCRMVWNESPR